MNHFVAFRISDAKVLQNVKEVQEKMLKTHVPVKKGTKKVKVKGTVFKPTLKRPSTMHVSLHVMKLEDAGEIENAKLAVTRAWNSYKDSFKEDPIVVHLDGMGDFYDEVLFVKVKETDAVRRITELANRVQEEIRSFNIPGEERPYVPHMTIAKISSKFKESTDITSYPHELWENFQSQNFGLQSFKGIQLLTSGSDPTGSGYFPSILDCFVD